MELPKNTRQHGIIIFVMKLFHMQDIEKRGRFSSFAEMTGQLYFYTRSSMARVAAPVDFEFYIVVLECFLKHGVQVSFQGENAV